MFLANRLYVPEGIEAMLWDMDGVLIDSLTFDYEVCNSLLEAHTGHPYHVSRETIRLNFPYDLPEFWKRLLLAAGVEQTRRGEILQHLVSDHQRRRETAPFQLNPGILDVLREAPAAAVKLAVVSNNPAAEIATILGRLQLSQYFTEIVGNDAKGIKKKPAPDAYLLAAKMLGCAPRACLVVEDSLIGAEAGRAAGCHVVGVATGAASLRELDNCPHVDTRYASFERENQCRMTLGNVRAKSIKTPNDFVSHMVEHLAWRLGLSIDLTWNSTNWRLLGDFVGTELARHQPVADRGAAFSMIDDGSAEVVAERAATPGLHLESSDDLDLAWFQSLRCEQVDDGTPLLDLLGGIAQACGLRFDILVGSLEDPHHTWEGIFRTVGIAMQQIYFDRQDLAFPPAAVEQTGSARHGWSVGSVVGSLVEVRRATAESSVRVAVDASGYSAATFVAHVAETIHVAGLAEVIEQFAVNAKISVAAEFTALELSSSHVVAEDTGLVLGRALKQLLIDRMNTCGINGAGSSVSAAEPASSIRAAISFEGRNSVNIVPIRMSRAELQRRMLIGHTWKNGLFTEDLDDFLYGLAQGMSSTITVHVHDVGDAEVAWKQLFAALGKSWAQAFAKNPTRVGVPPGVKATLF